jgi:ferredoxin
MKHLIIDTDKCIGCGLCKQVCIRDNIEIIDKKAVDVESNCFDCGQCSTSCPTNAITINIYSGQDDRIEDYDPDNVPISYDDLLQFYKQRRTCRWFKDEKISHETIEKLMEAAYYSPNRQNIQDVEFALVDNRKKKQKVLLNRDIMSKMAYMINPAKQHALEDEYKNKF